MFIRRLMYRLLLAKIEQRLFERVSQRIADQEYLRGGAGGLRVPGTSLSKPIHLNQI